MTLVNEFNLDPDEHTYKLESIKLKVVVEYEIELNSDEMINQALIDGDLLQLDDFAARYIDKNAEDYKNDIDNLIPWKNLEAEIVE